MTHRRRRPASRRRWAPHARPLPAHAHLRPPRSCSCAARAPRSGTTTASATSTSSAGLAVTASATPTRRSPTRSPSRRRTLLHVSNLFGTEPGPEVAGTLDRLLGGGGQVFFCNSRRRGQRVRAQAGPQVGRPRPPRRGQRATARSTAAPSPRSTPPASPQKHEAFQPLPEGFRHVAWNDLDALEAALDPTVAAVLLEPVQGEGGVNPATPEYFQGVRRLCDERGILFMVDEVQTGLGRTGRVVRPPALRRRARRRHDGQGARQRRADRRLLGEGARWPPCSSPATTPRPIGGQPLATAAARAVLERDGAEDVPARDSAAGKHWSRRRRI